MLRIQEALDRGKITKKELAEKLGEGKNASPQYQNLRLLMLGKTKTYTFEQIAIIYKECGVDPNFLWGYEKPEE